MGKGGGKSITVGYRYYMSIHMGLCRGPIDEIVQINVGDLRAWPFPEGDTKSIGGLSDLTIRDDLDISDVPEVFKPFAEVFEKMMTAFVALFGGRDTGGLMFIAKGPTDEGVAVSENGYSVKVEPEKINTWDSNQASEIRAAKLFGGDKKEGGIDGIVRVLMGGANQTVPGFIKNLMGGLVPDFRGVATVYFDGLLTSLNPYPKKWSFRVRRTTSGWDGDVWEPDLATIWLEDDTIKAMNPAHIVYECLTNSAWGRGFPREWINEEAFRDVAQKLYDESFGLCLRWNRQASIGEFIQQVIDHVGGSIYVDRNLGLITMSLLRDDYDPETLPTFDYNSGLLEVEEDETLVQPEIVNEIITKWKKPLDKTDRESRVQNLAAIQTLGSFNSATNEYKGLPTDELAYRVAQRDLRVGANSLRKYKIKLDRRAWKIVPGDVFRISAPDKDIFNAVLRAGDVRDGSLADGVITVEATLDVFGLPESSFVQSQYPEWNAPSRNPQVPSRRLVREATYPDMLKAVGPGDLATIGDDTGAIATLVSKPSDQNQGYTFLSRAEGEDDFVERGIGSFAPSAVLSHSLTEATMDISFDGGVDFGLIEVGMSVQIGNEICRLDAIDADGTTGTATIARGCVDTIPVSHSAGTPIYFFNTEGGSDGREYAPGENVEVKILTFTSSNGLSEQLAPTDNITVQGRQGRVWSPGNVLINGEPYYEVDSGITGGFTLSWGHRNRLVIQDQLLAHSEGGTSVEEGTTYTVRIYNDLNSDAPVRTVTGIEDTTFTYTNPMASDDGVITAIAIELEAVHNGVSSLFVYRMEYPYQSA